MFIVYKNVSHLLSTNDSSEREYNIETNQEERGETVIKISKKINSNIISFKMSQQSDLADLKSEPIRFSFRHLVATQDDEADEVEDSSKTSRFLLNSRCVFWDYNKKYDHESGILSEDLRFSKLNLFLLL